MRTVSVEVHMLTDAELIKLLADERSAAYGKGVTQGRIEGDAAGYERGYGVGYEDGQSHDSTEVSQ